MIVKNESDVILESLSRVCHLVDFWVICDTGSTDNTSETIQRFFAEKGIPGELHHDTWKNFAHNRTLAFSRARSRADYAWVLDADDLLTGTLVFPIEMSADAYSLFYGDESCIQFQRPQLFSSQYEWEYRGVLHEFPCRKDSLPYSLEIIEGNYYIDYMHSRHHTTNDRGKNPLKYLRDAQLMEKALETEKNNMYYWRYVYYIGQSYYDFGDFEKALTYFTQHVEGIRNQDTYYCHFYLASILKNLDPEKNAGEMLDHYFKGIALEPDRAECPYFLAQYYFDTAQYEKALSTLALCKKLKVPRNGRRVMSSIYRFDAPWLSIQICHFLGRHKDEQKIWEPLLENYPEVVERVDVRLYPLAVEWLQRRTEDIRFPDSHRFCCKEGWLVVKPWDLEKVVPYMLQHHISKMYLARGEALQDGDGGDLPKDFLPFVENTQTATVREEWWKETLCTRYPLTSYESLAWEENNLTVSLEISGISAQDLLTTFFLFALCGEMGFRFRLSTRVHRGTLRFTGTWSTRKELQQFLSTQPVLSSGDFFRADWLPSSFQEQTWPLFQTFVGAVKIPLQTVDDSFQPQSFADVVGVEIFEITDRHHPLWPLIAHLVVLFPVDFCYTPSFPLLDFEVVSSEIKHACWKTPVRIVAAPSVQNQILCYSDIFLSDGTLPSKDNTGNVQLHLQDDFVLSEPYLTWQVRFMDLVRHARQWKKPWSLVHLVDGEEGDSSFFLSKEERENEKDAMTYHYPLLRRLEPAVSRKSSDFYFFPHLHFIDSEVYYAPVAQKEVLGCAFDGYNDFGFYKKWASSRVQHFEMDASGGYPGDWVAIRIPENGSPRVAFVQDHLTRNLPKVPSKQIPIYAVGATEAPPLSCITMVEVDRNEVWTHLSLWNALIEDAGHDYYVVIDKKASFSLQKPYLEDTQANMTMTIKNLYQKPSWDILLLGTLVPRDSVTNVVDAKRGVVTVEPYHPGYGKVLGYVLHKKTAAFMMNVVRHCGYWEPLEEMWEHFTSFFHIFQLSFPLVTANE
jgi:glycosyltransferase involved in cell wall biosynthesis